MQRGDAGAGFPARASLGWEAGRQRGWHVGPSAVGLGIAQSICPHVGKGGPRRTQNPMGPASHILPRIREGAVCTGVCPQGRSQALQAKAPAVAACLGGGSRTMTRPSPRGGVGGGPRGHGGPARSWAEPSGARARRPGPHTSRRSPLLRGCRGRQVSSLLLNFFKMEN